MYRRILVATDGSRLSKKAVTHAIALATDTGATLIAFSVVPRYPVAYFEGAVSFKPDEIARTEKLWTDEAQERVDAVRQQAEDQGLDARAAVVRSDDVAASIIAAARKHKADLIVMASHGRKGIKRLLLGSETQHVLALSTLPVLILR